MNECYCGLSGAKDKFQLREFHVLKLKLENSLCFSAKLHEKCQPYFVHSDNKKVVQANKT